MDLRLNLPPRLEEVDGQLAAALEKVRSRENFSDLLQYGPSAGTISDRDAAASWLRPLFADLGAEDVLIAPGGATLLVALVTLLAQRADAVVAEELTYPGIRAISRHFGTRLVGVPIDHEGIVPEALADACRAHKPKALYCTPTIHNPTTATMSHKRREQIAEVAAEFDLAIIEDDAYALLPNQVIPPLASFAPERTYYIASLSKCISPGLRVAYCVPPTAKKAQATEAVRVMSIMTPRLLVALASQCISENTGCRILAAVRAECAERQLIAKRILSGLDFAAHPQGPHIWLNLRSGFSVRELGEQLRNCGIAAKGDGFRTDDSVPDALRIALGAAGSQAVLAVQLEALAKAVRQ